MYPSFFGKYSTSFQVTENQSAIADLEKNDLQVGMGTLDGTGSSVEFSSIAHENGLAVVNLNGKTVPQTYYYDGNTGNASSVRAASTTTATVWPSVNFSSATIPYSASNTSSLKKYLAIVKPSTATTISTTATSGCEAWSLSYNVSKNTSSSQSVTSSRPGYYLGWVYSCTGSVQTFIVPTNGTYQVELWGGNGGNDTDTDGGRGGYVSGNISLNSNSTFYICIGYSGGWSNGRFNNTSINAGSWSAGAASGGGSTDLRYYYNSDWKDFNSLKSRIIVAAGGGGSENSGGYGGYAGGLQGGYGVNNPYSSVALNNPGTQTSGYKFGLGYYTRDSNGQQWGGGGNGYYSGETSIHSYQYQGGAGGSSFISGHSGCNAISESSTESNIIHTGQANHYSGYVFTNTVMKAGNESMPSPSGDTETGHTGDGCAIITQLSY